MEASMIGEIVYLILILILFIVAGALSGR